MRLCLFADDDYEEVATKVTGSLSRWGCWDARWSVPTASGLTQARKWLGPQVLAEVFEQVVCPVATMSTRGAWLRGWRLVAIEGFEVDVPDAKGNAVKVRLCRVRCQPLGVAQGAGGGGGVGWAD